MRVLFSGFVYCKKYFRASNELAAVVWASTSFKNAAAPALHELVHVTVFQARRELAERPDHRVVRARVERGQPLGEFERDARPEANCPGKVAVEHQEVQHAPGVDARRIGLPVFLESPRALQESYPHDVFLRARDGDVRRRDTRARGDPRGRWCDSDDRCARRICRVSGRANPRHGASRRR